MLKEATYYQFCKEYNYPVFVRFENSDFEQNFQGILETIGFTKLSKEEMGKVSLEGRDVKVLRVKEATLKVSRQIDTGHMLEMYGPESLTSVGNYDVYRYKGIGMLIFGEGNFFWELGLKNYDNNQDAIKTIFVRFLSWALASRGIVGFWGVPVGEGFVVMKPNESKYESIFVDIKNGIIHTQDGIKYISTGTQILRLDETLKKESRVMRSEALVSFLCTNTCFFSYKGLDFKLRKSIFELAEIVRGYIYPVENYQPRTDMEKAS